MFIRTLLKIARNALNVLSVTVYSTLIPDIKIVFLNNREFMSHCK
jgi:hypothetical protein